MGTSGTFEIVRTPASYIISQSGHGKWEKTGYFRILANYSDAQFFKRYPGYAIGKLTSRAFWKCRGFCCYNFLNRSYGCSKLTESEILAMLAKIKVVKKLTLLSYCKLRLETNMTSSQPYWGPILFVSNLNLHYDESVSFFGQGLSTGFLFSNLTQLQPAIRWV